MNGIGIRNIATQPTDFVIVDAVLMRDTDLSKTTGLNNSRAKIRAWIPITTTIAPAIVDIRVSTSANLGFFATFKFYNTVAQTMQVGIASAQSTVVSFGVNNVGTHWIEVEAFVMFGQVFGSSNSFITIMGQQSVGAFPGTFNRGATMDIVIY